MNDKSTLRDRYRALVVDRKKLEAELTETRKETVDGALDAVGAKLKELERKLALHQTAEAETLAKLEGIFAQELRQEYERIPATAAQIDSLTQEYQRAYGAALAAVMAYGQVSGMVGADRMRHEILDALEYMESPNSNGAFKAILRGYKDAGEPQIEDLDKLRSFVRVTKNLAPGSPAAAKVINKRLRRVLPELPVPPEPVPPAHGKFICRPTEDRTNGK